MQAREQVVQLRVARGDALDAPVVLHQLLDLFKRADQHRLDGLQLLAALAHCDVVDGLLGPLQDLRVFLVAGIALLQDALRGGDQPAQRGLLVHDLDVGLHVGRGGHALAQLDQIGRAAHGIQTAPTGHFLVEGHQVDGPRFVGHGLHGGKDFAVGGIVEVVGPQALHGDLRRIAGPKHRAQHAALGNRMVRRRAGDVGSIAFHRSLLKRRL